MSFFFVFLRRKSASVFWGSAFLFLCVCTPTCGLALELTLAWDRDPDPDIAGYRIHYGTSSLDFRIHIDVGNETECLILGLEEGRIYYFAASAYDINGRESVYSGEVIYIPPYSMGAASVVIGGTAYPSLQSAYDAARDGDVIKCRDIWFVEGLKVGRNISVTLDGGYDYGFTSHTGSKTIIKGMITTTAGGGTIMMRNIILEK